MDFSTKITVGGQPVILVDQATIQETRAWMKANSIFIPLGPAYSEAWLLMTASAIRALSPNGTHSVVWEQRVGTNSTTSTFLGWRLAPSERLLQGGVGNSKALFLAHFVDGRYLAALNSDTGAITANIRSYAQSADYLTGTSGYTWTSLLTLLWDNCVTLGAWPGLPAGLPIDGIPETTFLIGLNAYQALNAVLNQLDCAIAHNPIAGTHTIVQLGGEQAVAANTARLEWDTEPIGTNADVAATIRLYFNKHYKNYGQEQDTELVDNWAYNGAGATASSDTQIAGASGTIGLWDDLPLIVEEDGTISNTAARDARLANRKARYITRATVPLLHKIFSGLIDSYVPGGQLKAVLFRNWGRALGGTQTEIIGGSDLIPSYDKAGLLNTSNYETKSLAPPVYENYSALDLGRRSYPTYPRLPNIVQVHHSGEASPGDTVSANADGVHPGRVKRVLNNTMTTYEDCWILFVDDYDTNLGIVDAIEDEYYLGRLCGVYTSGAVQNPLYLVKKGEGSTPIGPFIARQDIVTGITSGDVVYDEEEAGLSGGNVTLNAGTGVFTFTKEGFAHVIVTFTVENRGNPTDAYYVEVSIQASTPQIGQSGYVGFQKDAASGLRKSATVQALIDTSPGSTFKVTYLYLQLGSVNTPDVDMHDVVVTVNAQ